MSMIGSVENVLFSLLKHEVRDKHSCSTFGRDKNMNTTFKIVTHQQTDYENLNI